jgi:predicted ester cyclase
MAAAALKIRSLDRLKEFQQQDTATFPDSRQTIVHMVAEDNFVGVWATYEGTQRGPIDSLAASGWPKLIR